MELEIFGDSSEILEVAFRGVIMFVYSVALLRIFGKRTTMTTASFDFIVTVALGSLLASTIVSTTRPIIHGMAGILALVALQWLISMGVSRSNTIQRIVVSPASILLRNGEIRRSNLMDERLSVDQLEQNLRQSGFASKKGIEAAILESSGSISVIGDTEGPEELIEKKEIGSRAI